MLPALSVSAALRCISDAILSVERFVRASGKDRPTLPFDVSHTPYNDKQRQTSASTYRLLPFPVLSCSSQSLTRLLRLFVLLSFTFSLCPYLVCHIQVVFEALLSFVLGSIGCSLWSGALHGVSAGSAYALRSYDSLTQHSEFETFSHRAIALQHINRAKTASSASTSMQ